MTNSIARNGPTPRAFDTIVYGGLIAGTLDAIDGVVAFGLAWRTPQEVLENLVVPLSKDWENFVADADSFVSEDSEVVAFGVYRGVNRATGRTLAVPFAHRWRVSDGRIASFVQYTDTILVKKAMP
ncbi:MAG: hypothetical protein DMG88_23915 [Acidobacteria bacterium]|nr:MAG: hypothetical protein DMG88_23915 [Acidobacteriota bacterium]